MNDAATTILNERIKYLETKIDCLENRINKEVDYYRIESEMHEKLRNRIMNDRQIEALEKAWQTLSEMDCILHPHQESPLLKELFVIISEQKELNANYKASK